MMDNPIPQELRADHLFLIMGGNPLPNWVAARLLLKPGGQVYLVCSAGTPNGDRGTYSTAQRLSQVLQSNGYLPAKLLQVQNEANAAEIFNAVKKAAAAIQGGQINCHYTGGTKAMSVHTYRAVAARNGAGLPPFHFTYLDARRQKMIFDPILGRNDSLFFEVGLAKDAEIDFKTLLQLHENHTIKSQDLLEPPQNRKDLAKELHQICMQAGGLKGYSGWRMGCLKNGAKFKDEPELAQLRLDETLQGGLVPLCQKVAALAGLPTAGLTLGRAAQGLGCPNSTEFAKWLDGPWLEDYTYDCIQQAQTGLDLSSLTKDIKIHIPTSSYDFQLDVSCMRGYQLYALSCFSGGERGTFKEHLIEVVTRARQIGGDAARAALVCYCPQSRDLQLEMSDQLDAPGQVKVFGASELRNLPASLRDWFQN